MFKPTSRFTHAEKKVVILGVGGTSTLALTFELCVSEALQ